MNLNIEQLRADTPGCERVVHFNNCGAGLMPRPVLEAVKGYLDAEASAGGYETAEARQDELDAVYRSVARLIGAQADEIAIVENATVAWDMAFYAMKFRPGDRILTSMAEYASNYIAFLQVARRTGVIIESVPDDDSGQLDVTALREMLDERVKLIAVTHVPTNGGLVNPAAAIGEVAHEAGIPFLLDACQSIGQLPIDVRDMHIDILSATSRKYLRGPRGVGFLYVRRELISQLEPPFLDLHAATWTGTDSFAIRQDARRFESWESNFAGQIGMGKAIDYALAIGIEPIQSRITALAEQLRSGLAQIAGVRVLDQGRLRCGIVSFAPGTADPEAVMHALRRQGINISTSSTASTRLDMEHRNLRHICRAGVHYYNDEREVGRFLAALPLLLRD